MLLIQYFIIIFAAFLIGRTLVNFQNHKLELKKTIIWIVIWTGLLIISLLPEVMGIPAAILGIQRSIDVFVYLGIIALFYIVFLLYSKFETQREQITKLTRVIAIQQAETEAFILGKSKKGKKVSQKPKKKLKKKKK